MHLTWSAGDNFTVMDCRGFCAILRQCVFCTRLFMCTLMEENTFYLSNTGLIIIPLSVYNTGQVVHAPCVSSWLEKQIKYLEIVFRFFTRGALECIYVGFCLLAMDLSVCALD